MGCAVGFCISPPGTRTQARRSSPFQQPRCNARMMLREIGRMHHDIAGSTLVIRLRAGDCGFLPPISLLNEAGRCG